MIIFHPPSKHLLLYCMPTGTTFDATKTSKEILILTPNSVARFVLMFCYITSLLQYNNWANSFLEMNSGWSYNSTFEWFIFWCDVGEILQMSAIYMLRCYKL